MDLITTLIDLDKTLFLKINSIHNPLSDLLMIFASDKYVWIPLYALFIFLIIKRFKVKSWVIIVSIVASIALADRITSGFFKPTFKRLRPCHNPELVDLIHSPNNHCGGQYGFVSSHAANSVAFAVCIFLIFSYKRRKNVYLLIIPWAIWVSISRVFLGVHFPADIFIGGLIGGICGYFCIKIASFGLKKYYNYYL